MNIKLTKQAEKLAGEPYTIEIMRDETTTGEAIYLVSHPELPGCMAQGETLEEATDNLSDATKEYIMSLLEDGLPVPSPSVKSTVTSAGYTTYSEVYAGQPEPTFLDSLVTVSQPIKRQRLGTISLVEVH